MRYKPHKAFWIGIALILFVVLAIAPAASSVMAQDDIPNCADLPVPQADPATYGDIEMTDEFQNATAVVCRDENGDLWLVAEASSDWWGRDEDPNGRLDWQTLSGSITITRLSDGTVIENVPFSVENNPRNEWKAGNDPTLRWSYKWFLWPDGGPYKLSITAVVRQQDCNNGSGEANAEVTASRQPPATPTATATNTPKPTSTNTPVPTATATAQPQNGTVKITKIAVVPHDGGLIAFLAPGWPMTITAQSGAVVAVTATEGNGAVSVSLPVGRYKASEAQLEGWVAEIASEVWFDVVAGQTTEVVFKNRELIESRAWLYLPIVCRGEGQGTPPPPTECPLIHFQSGSRTHDTGISPGSGPDKALRFWVDGSYTRAVWKVYEVETRKVLYNENLPCNNGHCETGLIYGTPEEPRPAPNAMELVTVQLFDLAGHPIAVCARLLWTDPPGDALTAASSSDMLNQFLEAVRMLHEMDQQ